MDEYWKRSGQIPAFGNWEFANELPITEYFENARQGGYGESDLYAVDFKKPVQKATRNKEKRYKNAVVNDKETRMRKQGKVYHVTEHPKPVDEDLYKISPQLLRTNKKKKMLGFISKCLLPAACVS
ncbi:uncharacterized protein LOC131612895 [Vicia villosa]|uniref:uncharacterized protein LOC131612895 n=1 Tax=Vicia villosa TaxID=3911 RepID=UPI00273CF249|nr:uncharacterized protein LOC131612895 [Vicia villosa]